jgi:hypothetical protein
MALKKRILQSFSLSGADVIPFDKCYILLILHLLTWRLNLPMNFNLMVVLKDALKSVGMRVCSIFLFLNMCQ